jgi:hypothetical protein
MANEQNLKPFTGADDPRRMNGRPKGTKNLATIIRELENEDFDWSLVPIKDKDKAKQIGAPFKAIAFTALAKAYSGDMKAAEWLRKSGYGEKLDITSNGETIAPKIISEIKPNVKTEAETTDSNRPNQ